MNIFLYWGVDMKELIVDALLDTVKLLPYLFITFLLLEILEHKLSKKSE